MQQSRRQFLQSTGLAAAGVASGLVADQASASQPPGGDGPVVATYYFPNYHPDPENEAKYGPGWTEWELMKVAVPRFRGHQQPKVPVWGHADESDPTEMARKIDAAADHGMDVFIFDWYWYPVGNALTVRIVMQTSTSSSGQIFWATEDSPSLSEDKSTRFDTQGGETVTYDVGIPPQDSRVTTLRVDPIRGAGEIRIESITVLRGDESVAAWEFETPGDTEGWTAGGQLTDVTVEGGALSGTSTGFDPLLLQSRPLSLEADAFHGPFLHRALERGFLTAPNRNRLQYALMWANHDWVNNFPAHRANASDLHYPGAVDLDTFVSATDYVIGNYLGDPGYWRLDGAAYFSFFQITTLVDGLGGAAATRSALDDWRDRAHAAGVGDLHLAAVTQGVNAGDTNSIRQRDVLMRELNLQSATSYNWMDHRPVNASFPALPYAVVRDAWETSVYQSFADNFTGDYHPVVSVGWDSSPRCCQSDVLERLSYPWLPVMTDNTPREFEQAVVHALGFAAETATQPAVFINAWNEWTEGAYLEPDQHNGYAHLAALRRATGARTPPAE